MQLHQDFIAIVQFFGRPILFLTSTANAKYEEIVYKFLLDQKTVDQPNFIT